MLATTAAIASLAMTGAAQASTVTITFSDVAADAAANLTEGPYTESGFEFTPQIVFFGDAPGLATPSEADLSNGGAPFAEDEYGSLVAVDMRPFIVDTIGIGDPACCDTANVVDLFPNPDRDSDAGEVQLILTPTAAGVFQTFTLSPMVVERIFFPPSPDDIYVNGLTITPDQGPATVPEPATWALMLIGFGTMGGALRKRQLNTWP